MNRYRLVIEKLSDNNLPQRMYISKEMSEEQFLRYVMEMKQ